MRHLLPVLLLICTALQACSQKEKGLDVGDPIPVFSLKDQDGKVFNSKDHVGRQKLVIYFYPKDDSPVCTKEACAFRDSYMDYTNAGAMVIGISSDSVASHKAFEEKYHLPFTLLSDPGNKVLQQFGVQDVLFWSGRETFVVDTTGQIVFHFNSLLKGKAHAEKVLAFLRKG